MVVNFRITINVVHYRLNFVFRFSFNEVFFEMLYYGSYFIIIIWNLYFLSANLLFFITNNLNTNLSVGAEKGKTSWQFDNWVSANNVSFGWCSSNLIIISSPIFITNSWGAKGSYFNFREYILNSDIYVCNAS